MGMAFTHQYRFAAAESVSKDKVPRAISIILLGGIVSAFIGPSVANFSKDLFSNHMYIGSYLSLAALTNGHTSEWSGVTLVPVLRCWEWKNESWAWTSFNVGLWS